MEETVFQENSIESSRLQLQDLKRLNIELIKSNKLKDHAILKNKHDFKELTLKHKSFVQQLFLEHRAKEEDLRFKIQIGRSKLQDKIVESER
jgi:hypothetical protein